jgi:hypothetical protein
MENSKPVPYYCKIVSRVVRMKLMETTITADKNMLGALCQFCDEAFREEISKR